MLLTFAPSKAQGRVLCVTVFCNSGLGHLSLISRSVIIPLNIISNLVVVMVFLRSLYAYWLRDPQIDLNDLLVEGSAEHREIRVSWAVVQLRGWDLCSTPSLGRFLP